jgi:hypothetical protein
MFTTQAKNIPLAEPVNVPVSVPKGQLAVVGTPSWPLMWPLISLQALCALTQGGKTIAVNRMAETNLDVFSCFVPHWA